MILTLDPGNDKYDILIERGSLARAGEIFNLDRKVVIVTDSGVPEEYAASVAAASAAADIFTFPRGEESKNLRTFEDILGACLKAGLTRGDCVVSVGGGVAGDIAGFAAACYMRGIDFYNVPTTLLSQVDSSIGGKTAVDFEGIKNIVGAFYQPKGVLIDPDTLETLDSRQISAGLAEAIKMAATCDGELFEFIEKSDDLKEDITRIIAGALTIKRDIVQQDPKETGLRKVLNFGHTIGHAIEAYYRGSYLHGECVAMGMLPMCASGARARLEAVLSKYNLPLSCGAGEEELMPFILHDKKMKSDKISVIYVPEIGKFEIREVDPGSLAERI